MRLRSRSLNRRVWQLLIFGGFLLLGAVYSPTSSSAASPSTDSIPSVGLYSVFEVQVINPKPYTNPFNFEEIELQATFLGPSGQQIDFFGFHDGDGKGGETGNVWKLRFMPDEVGLWTYVYIWTDGTPGAAGSFNVVDRGLPGPLAIADDNSWYFMDARGRPFHWRGYDLHSFLRYTESKKITQESDLYKKVMQEKAIDRGYNFLMWNGLMAVPGWQESWWLDLSQDKKRFNPSAWATYEDALRLAQQSDTYIIIFSGIFYQGTEYQFKDLKPLLRYWVARFGPFYNFFGWSPTWEWTDIWSPQEVNEIMQYLDDINPFSTMLTIHDCSHSSFVDWLSFSMRQAQSRDIFEGNSRTAGQRQGACDGKGGVGDPFLNLPIIGSEDIWETKNGNFGQPRNATEVRRAAWGIMMAGVLPLYSEWHPAPPPRGGEGTAEPDVRRMFDFFYGETQYRRYQQLNDLVSRSERQIASGIPGEEYLIYDENGGEIRLDLRGIDASILFSVFWLDPVTGAEKTGNPIKGGDRVRFDSPFSQDTVLLLRKQALDTTPPTIVSVELLLGESQLAILFSKPVETQSATKVDNYRIDQGITISAAVLDETLKRVVLTTSPHWSENGTLPSLKTFTLTVNGIWDRADPPNMIAADTRITYSANLNQLFLPVVQQGLTLSMIVLLIIGILWSRFHLKNRLSL